MGGFAGHGHIRVGDPRGEGMKAEKIRELDEKELAAKSKEMEDQIFRLKFQMGMGQMDGLKKYRELRKDRARVATIQQQRALASAKEGK